MEKISEFIYLFVFIKKYFFKVEEFGFNFLQLFFIPPNPLIFTKYF